MNVKEAAAAIGEIEVTLGKASKEILAKIEELNASVELSPQASSSLARIGAIATMLDQIVPDKVDPEAPAPVITPIAAEPPAVPNPPPSVNPV